MGSSRLSGIVNCTLVINKKKVSNGRMNAFKMTLRTSEKKTGVRDKSSWLRKEKRLVYRVL